MKESPKRYTNPFLSDEENEKVNLWNQELEHSNFDDDLTKNCEGAKLINSLAASEFGEKETEFYTIKNVMECDLPEPLVCYKEDAFHVKDICVDEGMPHGERILFDENSNVMLKPELLKFSSTEDCFTESNLCSEINGKIDTSLTVLELSNDHMNIENDRDEVFERKVEASSGAQEVNADLPANTQIQVQDLQNAIPDFKEHRTNGEAIDSIVPNELKEMCKADSSNGDELSSQSDTGSKDVDNDGPGISLQPDAEQIHLSDVPSLQQDQPLPSLKSLLESADQQACLNPVDKISETLVENKSATDEKTTLNLKNAEPATSNVVHNNEHPQHVNELSVERNSAPKLHDAGSDNIPVINPMHRGGEGESSFSVAGPISGLVTHSGPILFNGSTSLRSDSSTTSTRSFAFPILQNEWNSSPVRMAKADRRRLPKHRGWRNGLLCCRF